MIEKLISGGQTGADRAGLEAAKALGIPTGGIAPKSFRICLPDGTDGTDSTLAEFGLTEHHSREYPPRTKLNATNSDGTVWFGYEHSSGGILTIKSAAKAGKPTKINPTPSELRSWLKEHNIKVLNVAGNRASDLNPTISEDTYNVLIEALKEEGDRP
ncbi:hypothetical protein AVDCRST_MAG94-4295 [uncultured Leptolyngbya sp.]|uniref:Molybdenum carrier n=1 Tax=uncultured Leptolyngbya sp. TaxID=332963 RepID=A0A6J4N254_9CYAN|nr:hypothetical protein AVDCRST_MAG94-4295 [uncultured Leptolyngbya sp.]